MSLEHTLRDLEQGFWKGNAEFYRATLARQAVMVFPAPVGILDRGRIIDSISQAPRWVEVEIHDLVTTQHGDGVAVLAYRAQARRESDPALYEALAGSVYVVEDRAWRLAFHQQTPG